MADRQDDPSPSAPPIDSPTPAPPGTDADRVLAVFANQTDWLCTIESGANPHADPSRIWIGQGLTAARTGLTGVLIVDPKDVPAPSTIDHGLRFLGGTGCGDILVWSAVDDEGDRALDLAFLSRGCTDSFRPTWMWRDLPLDAPADPERSLAPGITISIAEEADRGDIAAATSLPYISVDLIHTVIDRATVPERERRVWIVVARKGRTDADSRVVGLTAVNLLDYRRCLVAALFNLAVDESERRQGIGTALTRAACEIAASRGAIGIGLNATPDGERIYRPLGFAECGSGQTWYLTGQQLHSPPNRSEISWAEALGRGEIADLSPPTPTREMPNGETPLAFAARFGQVKAALWLLSHGVEPEIGALWTLGMREEAQTLASESRYLNAMRCQGMMTELHAAILAGDEELAGMLIAAGADLTVQDGTHHGTPLRWAEVLERPAIAALIAGAGGTR